MPTTGGSRSTLLAAAAAHVLKHGLAGLSLSQLSRAIGSSNRMLLYHFGSLDNVIAAVVGLVVASGDVTDYVLEPIGTGDGPVVERIDRAWARLASPELRGARELFFGYFGQVVHRLNTDPAFATLVRDTWTTRMSDALATDFGPATIAEARAIVALWRGLQMDLLAGADAQHVAATHSAAVRALLAGRPRARRRTPRTRATPPASPPNGAPP